MARCCGSPAQCLTPATDPNNCGECGVTCGTANGGTCCSGLCVQTANDPNNCGACGSACTGGRVCSGGTCVCPANKPTLCNGVCTDQQTDRSHCGSCGSDCTALYGATGYCDRGACFNCDPNACRALDASGRCLVRCGPLSTDRCRSCVDGTCVTSGGCDTSFAVCSYDNEVPMCLGIAGCC
jgi:hypothetical protein